MRGRGEAAGHRHVQHRKRGLAQQGAGAFQPQVQIIARRGAAHIFAEQPLKLAAGQPDRARQLRRRNRVFQVVLHEGDGGDQLGVAVADAHTQRHALAVGGLADAVMDKLFRHRGRQIVAVLQADQMQHHVHRGAAAGAGEDRPVDLEQVAGYLDIREFLYEARDMLPMQRAAPFPQQPGARQQQWRAAQAAHLGAVAGQAAQLAEEPVIEIILCPRTAAQDQGREALDLRQRHFRHHGDAVAGGHRFAILGEDAPLIKRIARQPVGGT